MSAKKIANSKHETENGYTSRDFGGRPVPRSLKASARIINRTSKRLEARWHRNSQEA